MQIIIIIVAILALMRALGKTMQRISNFNASRRRKKWDKQQEQEAALRLEKHPSISYQSSKDRKA
jgi:uncharacterized protein HemY